MNGSRTTDSARIGVLVVVGLNTAFIALDWKARPDRFEDLLAVRLLWDMLMGFVYWGLARGNPVRTMIAGLYLTGLGMLSVIGLAGGTSSSYWPGMMILFLGIPVMLPLSVRQAALAVSVMSTAFVCLPVLSGNPLRANELLAPAFFVLGAAVECVASTAALERLRLNDFAQRREIEEARDHLKEMDRLKARFTANVHHELRTPLTLTLAPLESLMNEEFGPLTEQQRSYTETMHTNALRLLKLINDLLDLAKAESKQLAIHRRPINAVEVVRQLVEGAKPLAKNKGIALTLRDGPSALELNADPDALETIVLNLIGNSLKFTGRGGAVRVAISPAESGGVSIAVQDTGTGLDTSQLARIFDRFAQVDSSETRKHEGTGIGLSLSKELVVLHNGDIWAESPGVGFGTTVCVQLPQGRADPLADEALFIPGSSPVSHDQGLCVSGASSVPVDRTKLHYCELTRTVEKASNSRTPSPSRPFSDGRWRNTILVCEDNPDMRRLLGDLLAKEFNVRFANDGREGLEAVEKEKPDLVLTDVMMPEVSGVDLCAHLKREAGTRGIPVVLITSKAEREMKIKGLEIGADDYITKPFHSRELLARVRSLIRLRALQDELATQNEALRDSNAQLARAMDELKEAETNMVQAERLAAVGELAAGIAHEVNNPVNFAKSAADAMGTFLDDMRGCLGQIRKSVESASQANLRRLLESSELTEAIEGLEELSEIVSTGLGRTGQLVGDLRDFSSPALGGRSSVDVARVMDSALQLTRYTFQRSDVDVIVTAQHDLPLIQADGQALGQVFLNILKNSAEAFDSRSGGEGRVVVSLSKTGGGVVVSIKDNACGVPPEISSRVFDPFFSTKPAGEGTGLGLSICRRVVAEHRGSIELRSAPGEGAEFRIWLPQENA